MQTNPAVEQSKIIRWSESPWNQSGRKGKGLWRKGFAAEQSDGLHYLILPKAFTCLNAALTQPMLLIRQTAIISFIRGVSA